MTPGAATDEWDELRMEYGSIHELQQVARLYIFPKVFPPLNFGDGLEGRAHFVAYTLQLCEGIKVHAQLNTVKGTDSVRFLAPSAEPARLDVPSGLMTHGST
ncbi:MAG: hypothetical protein WDW38_008978 [Sanguina aurantia]